LLFGGVFVLYDLLVRVGLALSGFFGFFEYFLVPFGGFIE
jgi:hypothetical protein